MSPIPREWPHKRDYSLGLWWDTLLSLWWDQGWGALIVEIQGRGGILMQKENSPACPGTWGFTLGKNKLVLSPQCQTAHGYPRRGGWVGGRAGTGRGSVCG